MCFSPYLGVGGGGLPKGLGQNLLMQFSSLGNSILEISKTDFFDIMTIHNDQISYVKHVLDFIIVNGHNINFFFAKFSIFDM